MFIRHSGLDFPVPKYQVFTIIIGTVGVSDISFILGIGGIFADPEIKDLAIKEKQQINVPQSFTGGLMVNIFNVKAFIFFVSLFSGVVLNTSTLFQFSISIYFFIATAV